MSGFPEDFCPASVSLLAKGVYFEAVVLGGFRFHLKFPKWFGIPEGHDYLQNKPLNIMQAGLGG